MRRIQLGGSGIETSCLGFGCASLGSRVAPEAGRRALAAALDAGVTWFDLAPAYGRGQAEVIAAPFLRAHRENVQICTKVGLAPAVRSGRWTGVLMPLARSAVRRAPPLRVFLRRSGIQESRRLPLSPDLVRRSLEGSLGRMGIDHVDLYALHDVSPEVLRRDEIRRTLEDLVTAGKARAVAVASDAAAAAAIETRALFAAIQISLPPPGAPASIIARAQAAGLGCVTHSVLGIGETFRDLRRRSAGRPEVRAAVRGATGQPDVAAGLAHLLVLRAFALNPHGVVLISMFSDRNRRQNLALAEHPPLREVPPLLDWLGQAA